MRVSDIAIGNHRYSHRCFHCLNRGIFCFPFITIGSGSSVQSQHGNASLFRHSRNGERIFIRPIPASAELQCHWHIHSLNHGVQNLPYQFFILQQGRAAPVVAYFFYRAAHININNLRTAPDIKRRALRQLLRICTCNLHRLGFHFARMINASAAFFRVP